MRLKNEVRNSGNEIQDVKNNVKSLWEWEGGLQRGRGLLLRQRWWWEGGGRFCFVDLTSEQQQLFTVSFLRATFPHSGGSGGEGGRGCCGRAGCGGCHWSHREVSPLEAPSQRTQLVF